MASQTGPVIGENKVVSLLLGIATWIVGLLFFFPIFWLVLNGFKDNLEASTRPTLFFSPTLERFRELGEEQAGVLSFREAATNSFWIVLISTILVMLLAIPAAYSLAIRPVKKWRDVLFFFISTKFLPIVGALMPLYFIAQQASWRIEVPIVGWVWEYDTLLNTRLLLVILYTAMNLPLAVWMLRSFFAEVPKELIEASQMDGTSLLGQIKSVILPIVSPGVAATALLCVIFGWNEFFLAVQLNNAGASTLPQWVASQETSRGNFIATLSAASVLATIPVVVAGWVAQKRMIRGLAMGAIK